MRIVPPVSAADITHASLSNDAVSVIAENETQNALEALARARESRPEEFLREYQNVPWDPQDGGINISIRDIRMIKRWLNSDRQSPCPRAAILERYPEFRFEDGCLVGVRNDGIPVVFPNNL